MPKIFSSLYILLDTGDTAKNELAIVYVLLPYSIFAPNRESRNLTQILVWSLPLILSKITKTHHYFSSNFLHHSVFTKRKDLCDNFINALFIGILAWTCLLPSLRFYEQFYLTKITSQEKLAFYNCYLLSVAINLSSLDITSHCLFAALSRK